MSTDNGRVARATMYYLPAKVIEGLIGVFTLSYLVGALSHAAYERFSTVNTIVVFANLLFLGWIVNSSGRYAGDYVRDRERQKPFYSTGAMLWAAPNLLAVLFGVGTYLIGGSLLGLAGAFMLLSTSLLQIMLSILVQTERKLASVALSVGAAAAKPAIMWSVCRIWASAMPDGKVDRILPAVLGYAISELLCGCIGAVVLHIPRSFSLKSWSKKVAGEFFHYGVPLLGVSVSVGLLNMVDRFLLILFDMDFGVYNANNTVTSTVFTMITVAIMRAVFPNVLDAWRRGGKEEAMPLLNQGVRLYTLIAMPAAVGLLAVCADISGMLYRSDPVYLSGAGVMGVSALAMFFYGLNEYAIKTWELRAKTVVIMQNALIAMAVKVAASLILLPAMGILGAAVGSLIGFVLYFTVSALRARKTLLFHLEWKSWVRIGAAALGCGVTAGGIAGAIASPVLSLAAGIPAGAAVYVLVLLVTGELRQEVAACKRFLRKRKG